MSVEWTIQIGSDPAQSFAELGLASPRRRLASQIPDVLTLEAPGAACDSSPVMSYGDTVIVFRDSARFFYGRVTQIRRSGQPEAEGLSYQIEGPWIWLERIVYRQTYNIWQGEGQPLLQKATSHLFLNQSISGAKLTNGQQIQDAVQWAITQGAPIAIGSITPALDLPINEVRDKTCADVVRDMLRLQPDVAVWFDYSTAPYPTLYCVARASLTPVSIAADDKSLVESINITPRYDLQVPYVHLIYESQNEHNGTSYLTVSEDIHPNPKPAVEFNGFVATIDLQGSKTTSTSAQIRSVSLDIESVDWWKSKHPWLADTSIQTLLLHDFARDGDLAYELVEGTVAEWMDADVEDDTITCLADIKFSNGDTVYNHPLSVRCRTTSASSNTYVSGGVEQQAEPQPVGLAASLYTSLGTLQFDGQISLVEAEVSGQAGLGNTLNVTGLDPAWETMAAVIVSIEEDWETGCTQITFGPAKHLTVGELVELLRATRSRQVINSYSMRPLGHAGGGSSLDLGLQNASDTSAQAGLAPYSKMVIGEAEGQEKPRYVLTQDGINGQIQLQKRDQADQLLAGSVKIDWRAGKTIEFREVAVCVKVSSHPDVFQERKMLVLASEIYD